MGVISLLVADEPSGSPLPAVRVSMVGQPREWVTDDNGLLLVVVPGDGAVVLVVRRLGYEPGAIRLRVASGDTLRPVFYMTPAGRVLDTIAVVAPRSRAAILQGYEYRLQHHVAGTFITREEIERRNAGAITDLIRRVLGVRVVGNSRASMRVISARVSQALPECPLRIVVDGLMREQGFSIDLIDPHDVHGVEVYPGAAGIPPEFGGMRKDLICGVVVVWTRVDR